MSKASASTTKGSSVPKKQTNSQNDSSKNKKTPLVKPLMQTEKVKEITIKPMAREKKKKNPEDQSLWDFTGDALSGMAKKALSHGLNLLTGFGDYDLDTNSLLASATAGRNGGVPMLANSKVANIVRHREYIRDILSSTSSFALQTLPINPGLDSTFPWLTSIANCYTNYRLRGMVFEFVSLASELATTPAIGYVAFATQYNSQDPVFTDKKSMENSEYANSTRIANCLAHPIECAANQLSLPELYIRNGAIPSGGDIKFYDIGRFSYAVGGQSASDVPIGELWCTYEVELFFPRLTSSFTTISNCGTWGSSSNITNGTTPLGNAAVRGSINTFAVTFSGSTINFPVECIGQTFLVVYTVAGTNAVITTPGLTGSAGLNVGYSLTGGEGCPVNGVASTTYSKSFMIGVLDNPVRQLTFGTAGVIPTNSQWVLYIVQVPSGFAESLVNSSTPSIEGKTTEANPISPSFLNRLISGSGQDQQDILRSLVALAHSLETRSDVKAEEVSSRRSSIDFGADPR